MRSSFGMNADIALRVVVLPVPVPPEMRMFSFPLTHDARNCAAFGEIEPNEIRSFMVYGSRENFLIVSVGPLRASGGVIAFTREPSGRRGATLGGAPSPRRAARGTIFLVIRRRGGVVAESAGGPPGLARPSPQNPAG